MHENLDRQDDIQAGSEKAFGIVFAVFFAVIALWPLFGGDAARWWAATAAIGFLGTAYVAPSILRPLNIAWFKFAMFLYAFVNPVTMAMIYYTTVVPTGLILRALGKDPLQRTFDADVDSYWIERAPPGPEPKTMKNQF